MDFRQVSIILWLYFGFSAAAGQDGEKLTGALRGTITLPAVVETDGSLDFRDNLTAIVFKGQSDVYNKDFKDRLQWDRLTGQFTIRDLRIGDTGTYTVKDVKRQNKSSYHITVYNQVSKPQVKPAAPCWLECSVMNGRDVSLSWYRGEERLNQTSSADLSRNLSLVLVSDMNSPYSCVVENPVSRKSINISDTCSTADPKQGGVQGRTRVWIGVGAAMFSAGSLMVVLLVLRRKRKTPTHTQDSDNSDKQRQEEEVQYAEVRKRSDQCNLSELDPCVEQQPLTSVYDKIQLHRITQPSLDTPHEEEHSQ